VKIWAMPLGVFLLDDHEVVRTGLRALLEAGEDIVVVGEAGTMADALARIPGAGPDVAILDVRLPDGSGVGLPGDPIHLSQGERFRAANTRRANNSGIGKWRPRGVAAILQAPFVWEEEGVLVILVTHPRCG
jgi:AmiR/NasT family two-component response regulator